MPSSRQLSIEPHITQNPKTKLYTVTISIRSGPPPRPKDRRKGCIKFLHDARAWRDAQRADLGLPPVPAEA